MDPQLLNKPKGKNQNINSKLQKNKIDVMPNMPIFEICKGKIREITIYETISAKPTYVLLSFIDLMENVYKMKSSLVSRKIEYFLHNVEISGFFWHSDFT